MKKLFLRKPDPIPLTKAGFDELVAKKIELEKSRPEAVEHLRLARAMGDLSENGYYKAARQKLSFIDSRLRHFNHVLKYAVITKSSNTGVIDIGSKVQIVLDSQQYEYEVVGGYESDPRKHTISYQSPLGKSIMGRAVGDSVTIVTPSGARTCKIIGIR